MRPNIYPNFSLSAPSMNAMFTLATYKWTTDIPDFTTAIGAIKMVNKETKPIFNVPRCTEKQNN